MKAIGKDLVIGLAILLSAWVLGKSYTYKYRTQDRIVVTGLGETEFTSDLIVWRGMVTAESSNVEQGYAQIEASKRKVSDYIAMRGIPAEAVVFEFVNVNKHNIVPLNISEVFPNHSHSYHESILLCPFFPAFFSGLLRTLSLIHI